MNVGQTIKELRREKKMTQTELAQQLFVSQDTISLWELGKSLPDVKALIAMSQLFGVTTDYILGLEK